MANIIHLKKFDKRGNLTVIEDKIPIEIIRVFTNMVLMTLFLGVTDIKQQYKLLYAFTPIV